MRVHSLRGVNPTFPLSGLGSSAGSVTQNYNTGEIYGPTGIATADYPANVFLSLSDWGKWQQQATAIYNAEGSSSFLSACLAAGLSADECNGAAQTDYGTVNTGSTGATVNTPRARLVDNTSGVSLGALGVAGFSAGDSYTVAITGGAPNSAVTVSVNGGTPVSAGTTDASGSYTGTGTFSASDVGSHTQVWYVGGTATNTLSYTVAAQTFTPQVSFTTPAGVASNSFDLKAAFYIVVTGAPPGSTVQMTSPVSFVFGTVAANGTFSIQWNAQSLSITAPGTYTFSFSFGSYTASAQIAFTQSFSPVLSATGGAGVISITIVNAPPSTAISLTIGGSSVSTGQTTSAAGTASFTQSGWAAGTYSITATIGSYTTNTVSATVTTMYSPHVKLTDTTSGASLGNIGRLGVAGFTVGDSFTLTLSGGTPNAPVSVSTNGSAPVLYGASTDGNGNFSLTGTWDENGVGSYIQVWYVGGIPANQLAFTVNPASSASTGTGTGTSPTVGVPAPTADDLYIYASIAASTPYTAAEAAFAGAITQSIPSPVSTYLDAAAIASLWNAYLVAGNSTAAVQTALAPVIAQIGTTTTAGSSSSTNELLIGVAALAVGYFTLKAN